MGFEDCEDMKRLKKKYIYITFKIFLIMFVNSGVKHVDLISPNVMVLDGRIGEILL